MIWLSRNNKAVKYLDKSFFQGLKVVAAKEEERRIISRAWK